MTTKKRLPYPRRGDIAPPRPPPTTLEGRVIALEVRAAVAFDRGITDADRKIAKDDAAILWDEVKVSPEKLRLRMVSVRFRLDIADRIE